MAWFWMDNSPFPYLPSHGGLGAPATGSVSSSLLCHCILLSLGELCVLGAMLNGAAAACSGSVPYGWLSRTRLIWLGCACQCHREERGIYKRGWGPV